jgi:hypothetical protein
MRKLNKKIAIGVAAAAIVAVGGGTAFAYWSTSGSGSGSATTGTNTSVSVAQVGSISALTPGSVAQKIDFSITNSAATNQYIASVAVSISSVESSPGVPAVGCSATDFSIVQPTAINSDLAHGTTTFSPSGATLALKDTAINQDGCKNTTVNLAFDAS